MKQIKVVISIFSAILFSPGIGIAQKKDLVEQANKAMLNATKYMVEKVSTNGGYVDRYLADLSRRWGELEAYRTQIWIQDENDGTIGMGNLFLDAYDVTGDEYYYEAANKVAQALTWGQLPCGGWNYLVDFAGNSSLQDWYNTIGKNAWGFEEFYHYYGNATFDDVTTAKAAEFLLRIYLRKFEGKYKPALDKAIQFTIESQYPLGGWPQRYPLKDDFPHGVLKDYTPFYTFNDEVISENIEFLIQCYQTLGDERFLDPIRRGMNFYLLTQQGNPNGGWAQQYDMDLKPAHGRSYEPASLSPGDTYRIAETLMKFYQYTGDRKFISRIPDAIQWLESCRLPASETENGRYSHPIFVEIGTNKALYAHRKGHSINDGHYWVDYSSANPLEHYGAKMSLDINRLSEEFKAINSLSPQEAAKNSPLKIQSFKGDGMPQNYFDFKIATTGKTPDKSEVDRIINALDKENRWLSKHEWISRPYTVSGTGAESNTACLSTEGGAVIRDTSETEYLSTHVFVKNMRVLIAYLRNEQH